MSTVAKKPTGVGVQQGAAFKSTTIQVTNNEPRTYYKCTFSDCRFNGDLGETKFLACELSAVTLGGCTDCAFVECRINGVAFSGAIKDTKFVRCDISGWRGEAVLERCSFARCALKAVELRTTSVLEQCVLRDTQIAASTLAAVQWRDVRVSNCCFTSCNLARSMFRRCRLGQLTLQQCQTRNSTFAGNVWKKCAWNRCDDAHSQHVADDEARTSMRLHSAPHASYIQHKARRARYEGVDWSWSTWESCRDDDATWIDVSLKNATIANTVFHNKKTTNVDEQDTTFKNVERTQCASQMTTVHFYDKADAADEEGGQRPVEVTLYTRHRRLSSTNSTVFELNERTAKLVDFIFVIPVLSWFASFGLSTPQSAHHLVSHISIGDTIFYPSKTPYTVVGGAARIGYLRRTIQRHNSEPLLVGSRSITQHDQ